MKCRICDAVCEPVFSGRIRRIHTATYNLCGRCGLLQIEDPFGLSEAYADAINLEDTGILQRNLSLARITTLLLAEHYSQAGNTWTMQVGMEFSLA